MEFRERQPAPEPDGDDGEGGSKELYPGMTPDQLKAALAFAEKKLQLVGSVTRHDVLNQLTAVMGYNELLGMMIEDPKLKTYLDRERHAVDKIRRQFQFAKDYQNIGAAPPSWQSLRQVIREASDFLDMRTIQVEEEVGDASVLADPQFQKVMNNLFENAQRHGNSVSRVRIFLEEIPEGIRIVVGDNGAGVPAGDKEKIFERGFGKGTGWGLFLAREILEFCGMSIRETGEPGSGARFEILVPGDKIRR